MMKKVRGIFIFLATLAIFGISTESFAKNRAVFSAQVNQPTYSTIEEYRDVYLALGGSLYRWRSVNSLKGARSLVDNYWTWIGNYRKIFGSRDQTWTGLPWTGTYDDLQTPEIENTPTYPEAAGLHTRAIVEIARLKTDYLARGGSVSDWTGTFNDPHNPDAANTPTLSEAQKLHNELVAEIQRLKAIWLVNEGSENTWTGSYDNPATTDKVENTPILSEAQALIAPFEIARLKTEYLALGGSAGDWTGTYDDPDTADVETTPTLSEAQALVQLLKHSQSSPSPSSNNHTLIIGVSAGVGGALLLGGLGYWFYRRRQKS